VADAATNVVALSARVEELEIKASFQEHLLGELDGVIQSLRDQLDTLHREHEETRMQVAALTPEPENSKPPHY